MHYGVTVVGNYAYVADYGSGLAIIDMFPILQVLEPQFTWTPVDMLNGVTVVGNYAYVADNTSGLAIIDISDPTSPGTPVYEDTSGYAYGVTVVGNYAYVADGTSGLAIIDISDPTSPGDPSLHGYQVELCTMVLLWWVITLMWRTMASGLAIIDMFPDPSQVLEPQFIWIPVDMHYGVTVVGNYAYVADSEKWFSNY